MHHSKNPEANATLRARALEGLENGAVLGDPKATQRVLEILDGALATEIICWLRYRAHALEAEGPHADAVRAEFIEHADQEQAHALRLAGRIKQLGGHVNLAPETLEARAHLRYEQGDDLPSMLKADLVAERIAIQSYRAAIREIGDSDPTTRRMLEDILAQEEEHADDLAGFINGYRGIEIGRA